MSETTPAGIREVHVVFAEGHGIEAVFADRETAERYESMGDMWIETWPVSASMAAALGMSETTPAEEPETGTLTAATTQYTTASLTGTAGWWLRRLADRIDHAGAPKLTHWTFTFERGEGIRFREDGPGCRVAYLGDDEYEKAHLQASKPL